MRVDRPRRRKGALDELSWLLQSGRRIADASTREAAIEAFRAAVVPRLASSCEVRDVEAPVPESRYDESLLIASRGHVYGTVYCSRRPSRRRSNATRRALIEDLVSRLAQTLADLHAQSAEAMAEQALDRMDRLQQVAERVSAAITLEDVAHTALGAAIEVFGAFAGGIGIWDPASQRVRLIADRGFPADLIAAFRAFPVDEPSPLAESIRSREPLWFRSREEVAKRFPRAAAELYRTPNTAYAAVPLLVGERAIGALALAFSSARAMFRHDRAFIDTLVRQLALALTRAQHLADETAARSLAEQAVSAREEFLSVAAHELRTPLTTLALHADGLARDAVIANLPPDARPAHRVTVMRRQVNRLARLVDVLLDVSRAKVKREDFVLEPFDLAVMARDVIDALATDAAAARSTVRLDAPEAVIGRWDRMRIEQVVTNLVGNALKFGSGSPVEIAVAIDDERAILRVRDHGIGIAVADQTRIFERFERAVLPIHYAGLGLGLWIVRAIVEAHGGEIIVTSELGLGSEFVVRLPR